MTSMYHLHNAFADYTFQYHWWWPLASTRVRKANTKSDYQLRHVRPSVLLFNYLPPTGQTSMKFHTYVCDHSGFQRCHCFQVTNFTLVTAARSVSTVTKSLWLLHVMVSGCHDPLKCSFITPTNPPFTYKHTVLLSCYMFRRHLRHTPPALQQALNPTNIHENTKVIHIVLQYSCS